MGDFFETIITLFKENPGVRTGILIAFAVVAIIMIGVFIGLLVNTHSTPSAPAGWGGRDYDADQNTRESLAQLIAAGKSGITLDTPITQLSVATANYGGIFTESMGLLNPWIGKVDPDAARLQVEAGARAIVFDIWPDPENPTIPVVCLMKDVNEWESIGWWKGKGLSKGVGQYSNWQLLTRNKVAASDMITAACTAAFGSPAPNVQTNDPFFFDLRLHGAMTLDYLNYLGDAVKTALGTHRMETQWDAMKNQGSLCSAVVGDFMGNGGHGFVIVSPDIQSGYNSLPNTNTWDDFVKQYSTTRMAEVTNVLESAQNTVFFTIGNLDAIASATKPACTSGGSAQTLAQAGFCVVQPTVGGQTTDNDAQIGPDAFQKARQVGAQFVAVNYFSPNQSDSVLGAVFDPALFGKYSFKKGA